ncbi:MAG: PilZ domain-containing protein [Deltaproteobacteria bacterium]|nr:PilZ domain-containing protein [Deltaproteobacteria bacterium]MBW1834813.1 PilZ domain-containing protein [Deltaproteobacteria bacterium]MBW2165503.1 PilZ domain-containing protein [Deltaproteobacteria bacterium]
MKLKHIGAEHRKHLRINERLKFKLKTNHFDVVTETINFSCIGAYCQANKYISLMTSLDIVLALPIVDKEDEFEYVKCTGLVVRVEKVSFDANKRNAYNIAIYFSEIEDSEKQKIESFVGRHREPKPPQGPEI